MELDIRPLSYEERKYTYAQSGQIKAQTGSIGRLRGDFDSGGNGFYTSWEDHCSNLKTPEFAAEFDEVVNALRSEECGLLTNRASMNRYGRQVPDSAMKGNYTTEYGFRINTDKYAHLLRCNPTKGDYNFYVFSYVKEWLDQHMEEARSDIRFIDSRYQDLFHLPDGERINIIHKNGENVEQICRYIDSTHVEIGNNLWHICEFAERMEAKGSTYAPAEPPLPPRCFGELQTTGEVIEITRYEKGYRPLKNYPAGRRGVEQLNDAIGVSKAQAAAMKAGSMFGWDCPAAKIRSYDEDGKLIKPKERER